MSKQPGSEHAPKDQFVNPEVFLKLTQLKVAAWHNALRLIDDAINAYKSQSYPTACFLAITAMEECAKVGIVAFMLRNKDSYEREGQELDEVVDKYLRNHAVKVKHPAFMAIYSRGAETLGSEKFKEWLDRAGSGYLKDLRNRSLYSGEWKKRIMEPTEQIKEEDASREICMALELATADLEHYYSDYSSLENHIEKQREESRLRMKLENFKAIRHNNSTR